MTRRSPAARARRIDRALVAVERRFGPGIVNRLRDRSDRTTADRALPSGSLALDLAIGTGGLPRGGITEFCGADTSGKSALLYAALASAQRAGGLAALIDAEGGADGEALAWCGVDTADLLLARPASATDALLILAILARCRGFDAIGLASIPALRHLPPGTARGGEHGDLQAPDTARLLARGLRVLAPALRDGPTAIIMTNDLIGNTPDWRASGGQALRHHAALRVAVEPLARLPDAAGGTRGLRVALTIAKSKVGPTGRCAEADLIYGEGLDAAGELLRLGLTAGFVMRDSLALRYRDTPLGRGDERARRTLRDDPALAASLRADLLSALRRERAA